MKKKKLLKTVSNDETEARVNDRTGSVEKKEGLGTRLVDKFHRRAPFGRRSFLGKTTRTLSVAALSMMGFSSSAIAKSDVSEKVQRAADQQADEYRSPNRVRDAVSEYASEALQILHDEGVLESPHVSTLAIDSVADEQQYLNSEEAVLVQPFIRNDVPTAAIRVKRRVNGKKLLIVVHPQVGEGYAIYGDRLITSNDDSVDTFACLVGEDCFFCGSWECCVYEVECCSGSCTYGDYLGACYSNCKVNCCETCPDC